MFFFILLIFYVTSRTVFRTYLCWSAQRPDFCRPRRKGPRNLARWPSLEVNHLAFELASRSSLLARPEWWRWGAKVQRPHRSDPRVTGWTRRVPEYLWTKRALLSCKYVDTSFLMWWKESDFSKYLLNFYVNIFCTLSDRNKIENQIYIWFIRV